MGLTRDALAVRVRVPAGGAGGAGRAVVHPAQQGAQVAHRDLLDEGGAVLAEVPPLEDLRGTNTQTNTPVRPAGLRPGSSPLLAPAPTRPWPRPQSQSAPCPLLLPAPAAPRAPPRASPARAHG